MRRPPLETGTVRRIKSGSIRHSPEAVMRFRFTKSKGTMIFGIWLIFLGISQLIQIVHKDAIAALIVITAGVFILFEF
jgi:hypothetical protein